MTATGVTTHVESGGCPGAPNMNRDEMFRFVRARDAQGVISNKLLGWEGSSTYEATGRSWNGEFYECYLCHREFNSLHGLNQHLNSPRRTSEPPLRCPDLPPWTGAPLQLHSLSIL